MDSVNDLSRYFSSACNPSRSDSADSLFSNMNSHSISSHFRFPSYRSVLWDRKPVGDFVDINIERFLPVIIIPIHILEQVYQYTQRPGVEWCGTLLGRYKRTGDSYVFNVDKFLSQRPENTELDCINIQTGELNMSPAVRRAIGNLESDDFPSVSSFINIFCQFTKEAGVCSLHGHIVVPTSTLQFVQIKPLRILNNPLGEALQKGNLSLPMNSVFQFGYLTLDQVRNAVPLTYRDALAFKWPLIGIWIYGQESDVSLQSVHVWASCMRFLYNHNIQDRVSPEPMTFLVLIVHPGPHNAVFYECRTTPSDNVLKLFNFGMTSIHLGSQTKSEVCFRWSFEIDDRHQSDFQSALNNCNSIDPYHDNGSNYQLNESRNSQRSASVPPLHLGQAEGSYRGHSGESHLRSKSASPQNVAIIPPPASLACSFLPEYSPPGISEHANGPVGEKSELPKCRETSAFDSTESAFIKPNCSIRQQHKNEIHSLISNKPDKFAPDISSSPSSGTENISHSQFVTDSPTKGLSEELLNVIDNHRNVFQATDYSGLSSMTLLQFRRQFKSLQQQINSLRESLEQHALGNRHRTSCCCHSADTPNSVESDIAKLQETVSDNLDRLTEQQNSSAILSSLRNESRINAESFNSHLQNTVSETSAYQSRDFSESHIPSAASVHDTLAPSSEAILNQLTDVDRDDSAGKERLEPSDTHSIHSRISSNRTLCRSQTSGAQENGQSELNSVSVEIKPPAAERTSASDSAGPEQSSSSNADSKIIDSLSEYSWSSHGDNFDRIQRSPVTSRRRKSLNRMSRRSKLSLEESPTVFGSSENDIFDIPRIQFVSLEESSSGDELDAISRRYLADKFSGDIVSEETNAGTSHISKYLLHFPDKA